MQRQALVGTIRAPRPLVMTPITPSVTVLRDKQDESSAPRAAEPVDSARSPVQRHAFIRSITPAEIEAAATFSMRTESAPAAPTPILKQRGSGPP